MFMDIRSIQKPLKEQYRREPGSSRITLTAKGGQTDTPLSCSVDIGRAIYQAEAHKGVGGAGTAACSGDLLLGALAACAQITCQLVAVAMGIATRHVQGTASGDIDAPEATPEQLATLQAKAEQYCVVMQTLVRPPIIKTEWAHS